MPRAFALHVGRSAGYRPPRCAPLWTGGDKAQEKLESKGRAAWQATWSGVGGSKCEHTVVCTPCVSQGWMDKARMGAMTPRRARRGCWQNASRAGRMRRCVEEYAHGWDSVPMGPQSRARQAGPLGWKAKSKDSESAAVPLRGAGARYKWEWDECRDTMRRDPIPTERRGGKGGAGTDKQCPASA